jgi:hypothetical protein
MVVPGELPAHPSSGGLRVVFSCRGALPPGLAIAATALPLGSHVLHPWRGWVWARLYNFTNCNSRGQRLASTRRENRQAHPREPTRRAQRTINPLRTQARTGLPTAAAAGGPSRAPQAAPGRAHRARSPPRQGGSGSPRDGGPPNKMRPKKAPDERRSCSHALQVCRAMRRSSRSRVGVIDVPSRARRRSEGPCSAFSGGAAADGGAGE